MEVFGFVVLVVLLLFVSAGVGVAALYCMNQYNIGGVPHTWKHRVWIPFVFVALFYLWEALLTRSPVLITVQ